jgi:hypothetical protein
VVRLCRCDISGPFSATTELNSSWDQFQVYSGVIHPIPVPARVKPSRSVRATPKHVHNTLSLSSPFSVRFFHFPTLVIRSTDHGCTQHHGCSRRSASGLLVPTTVCTLCPSDKLPQEKATSALHTTFTKLQSSGLDNLRLHLGLHNMTSERSFPIHMCCISSPV